jgi:hypothetical protein
MSNLVFPTLIGLEYPVKKTAMFNTTRQKAKSGRDVRIREQDIPLWKWSMSVNLRDNKIRAGQTYNDLDRLNGLFLQLFGQWDSFLFLDPTDNQLNGDVFGTGNAATVAFQIGHIIGGFLESVYDFVATPAIFTNDWQGLVQRYTTSRTNLLLQSQTQANASWQKNNGVTVTTGIADPQGGTNAVQLNNATPALNASIGQVVASISDGIALFALSFWVKAGTATKIAAGIFNGTDSVWLNSSISIISGNSAGVTFTPVGGGQYWRITGLPATWVRIQIVTLAPPATGKNIQPLFYPTSDDVSASTNTLFFGAQLEKAAASTYYIPTTTVAVSQTDIVSIVGGLVTFTTAPLAGVAISSTGQFYYRCIFSNDYLDADNFTTSLWNTGQVDIESLKP